MSAIHTCSVVSSLVPMFSARNRAENNERPLEEKSMCAIALLIAKVILNTIEALSKRDYKSFDSLVGDGRCQNQALELRNISQLCLNEELEKLQKITNDLINRIKFRKGNVQERNKLRPTEFFSQHVESIEISKEMEHLLLRYLLGVTRVPKDSKRIKINGKKVTVIETLANGFVQTRTNSSALQKLSAKAPQLRDIVENAKRHLSELNRESIRREADRLKEVGNNICIEVLSRNGSLFYEVKTVLYRLREEGAIVALKGYVENEKPFYLYMQPSEKGGAFMLLSDRNENLDAPVVVFEAFVDGDLSMVVELIEKQGFTDLTLTCAAKDSDMSAVKLEDAQLEIEAFRKQKVSGLSIKHVYLSTIGVEG